jgi:hypothetical protein
VLVMLTVTVLVTLQGWCLFNSFWLLLLLLLLLPG